jgi:hypothetical protein
LVELAVGHCYGDDPLLADVRGLGLRIPGRAATIVAVIVCPEDLNVIVVVVLVLVVLVLGVEFTGEEVDIAEVSRSEGEARH